MRPLIAALVVVLLVTGCSFQHPLSVKDDAFSRGDESGVIVISVRRPFYGLTLPTPTYGIKGTDQTFVTILSKYSKSASSFSADGYGFVETLQLPVGQYKIYNWELFFNTGLAQWSERSIVSFSIPFTVQAGKVNYLGEIALDDYVFQFRSMQERDMGIVSEQHPFLKGVRVVYHPLSCVEQCLVPHAKVGTTSIHTPILPAGK